ncbi:MAG: TSUP family transporter, partial [Mycobacterium sp.]
MLADVPPDLVLASATAFGLAMLSAVAGFGGGVLLLPVFTALFGLRVAVPMLTLTQLASNGSRVWLNRVELRWRMIGWFALGAVPCAVAGGLLLARAPLAPLPRALGVFLIAVVIWRRLRRQMRTPADPA